MALDFLPGDLVYVLTDTKYPEEGEPFDIAKWSVGLVITWLDVEDEEDHWYASESSRFLSVLVDLTDVDPDDPIKDGCEIVVHETRVESDLKFILRRETTC